jgi:transcriptional regulator with XRE-family HTH domain
MARTSHISAAQLRAARAILNWSQEELATVSELSINTIAKLELGNLSPREQTGRALHAAFEKAGIEFIDPDGARRKPEEIIIYEGREGIREFYKDVEQASMRGGDIVQVWPSRKGFENTVGPDIDLHVNIMMTMKDSVPHKCIYTEVPECPPRPWCEHRFLSKHFVASVPFFVYDDKYVIVSFTDALRPKIIVVQSSAAAASFRHQFYSMWEKASPLPPPEITK